MSTKFKTILLLIIPVVLVMSSCLKDDVEDLEKKLNDIEQALGSNEPIVMNFATTTEDGVAVDKNAAFLFKISDYQSNAIYDYGDSIYGVYVFRGLDINFNEYVAFYFEYDAETKEISDEEASVDWRDQFGRRIDPDFDPDDVGTTLNVTVSSFDPKTGQVSVTFDMSTTADSDENEYDDQPMTCKLDFKGKLAIFKD